MNKEDLFYIKDISKRFINGKVLTFSGEMIIKRGYITFLTGESGIGKSTLLHILGLLDKAEPEENSWLQYQSEKAKLIDYFKLYKKDRKYRLFSKGLCANFRRHEFGFLPQNGHLLNSLSIVQNLEIVYLLRLHLKKGDQKIQDELNEVLKKVGLDFQRIISEGDGNYSPAKLSGGESQRLALARAILFEPKVIFVDEPTTFMDDELIKKTMELLLNLIHRNNSSIIIVTHQYKTLLEILNQREKDIHMINLTLEEYNRNEKTTKIKNEMIVS